MTIAPAIASNLSYDAISTYAERVGNKHGIYTSDDRADVWSLVEKLDGEVVVALESESLHVREGGDFTIYIPPTTSERRNRFTIAHELGHYYLHHLLPRASNESDLQFSLARGGRDRAETEANVFAASLLMPETEFRKFWLRRPDAWRAAAHFDVSPDAASLRAQLLAMP